MPILDLRSQAAETLQQARGLPIGAERNELRQRAIALRWLDKRERSASCLAAMLQATVDRQT